MTQTTADSGRTAIVDIAAERQRQISNEGWTFEHDDIHTGGELALAAALYATPIPLYQVTPYLGGCKWSDPFPWQEPSTTHRHEGVVMERVGYKRHGRRRQLVIAAALIVAEIERIDRAARAAAKGAK